MIPPVIKKDYVAQVNDLLNLKAYEIAFLVQQVWQFPELVDFAYW